MHGKHDDELLMYLEIIERRALAVESLIERAKLDTVLNIRKQIEAEFNGLSIERIPAKCHQKIDRAIQRYLELELNKIRAEYENKETALGSGGKPEGVGRVEKPGEAKPSDELGELERENRNLRDKIESLETSINRVDMLYLMQKKENEYLAEKVSKLERQLTNEKLKYENDLDDVKSDFAESRRRSSSGFSREKLLGVFKTTSTSDSDSLGTLQQKLEQQEKLNKSLEIAGDANQTRIRCLEDKVGELEKELGRSRQEVVDLLQQIRDLQGHAERRERKLREREVQLKVCD